MPGVREGLRAAAADARLHNKRRTDRLTVDLAELATQMSFARAARNATSTWVLDSCAETTVASHSRDTTSRTATAHRFEARKWVKS